jgi:uncharacterized repeat protein (TIGR03803 family)
VLNSVTIEGFCLASHASLLEPRWPPTRAKERSPYRINYFAVVAVVLSLALGAWAQPKYKVLYDFKGGTDGAVPFDGVTIDQAGNLYGTTAFGGTCGQKGGCGTVFKMTPHGNGTWTEKTVHSFSTWVDGWPRGGLVADEEGNLYGTAGLLFFELTAQGGWKEYEVLYSVFGWTLLMNKSGNFYGGSVFEIGPDSGGWDEKTIYTFHPHSGKDGTDGYDAQGPLIWDASGNLYGATQLGGNYSLCSGSGGCGTVFELVPESGGTWKEHVLHRFAQFHNDGQLPYAGVVMDGSGNLYGTTIEGGNFRNGNVCLVGCGTVFKLARGADGHWTEVILHNFGKNKAEGIGPGTPLVIDKSGNLYGMTNEGGDQNCFCGVVFKLSPQKGGGWKYGILHVFTGGDGGVPVAGLTLDAHGKIYGATPYGGAYGNGVVFQITP